MIRFREGELLIPREWYKDLVNQNGRSDWLAISILAELTFCAKNKKKLDNVDGVHTNTYIEYFCNLYGVSKVCCRRAFKRLQKKGFLSIGGKHAFLS